MNKIYYLLAIILLVSCSSLKKAEKSMMTGNYVQAYDLLIKEYQKGMSPKNHQKFLPTFQNAYIKMVNSQESRIENLKSANNPAHSGEIYETLANLNFRQEQIRAFLPIHNNGKEMIFPTKNYQPAILQAKNDYVVYLYDLSNKKIKANNKGDIRNAHSDLKKIQQLSPGYKDVDDLLNQAHYKGTDFVLIQIENRSNQMVPKRLEKDLTQMNTYGLDNFWTEFHQKRQDKTQYDYLIQMDIEHIMVSPERMYTEKHNFNKEIKDGWEYLYRNGQQVMDSLGKPIKVDKFITVSARVEETFQEKDALVQGNVELINLRNDQVIDRQKLNSEFGFRNHFGKSFGDKRALDDKMLQITRNRFLPFPAHEQMVFDCGEEIKAQLKQMLKRRF